MSETQKTLDISWRSIFKIGFSAILFYFLFLIREIVAWIIFSFVLYILVEPIISFLSARKIPRWVSSLIIYLSIVFFIGFSLYIISLPIFVEIQGFLSQMPQHFNRISPYLRDLGILTFNTFQEFTNKFQEWLINSSRSFGSAISSIFGGILSAVSVFSLAFFLSIEEGGVERIINFLMPQRKEWFLQIWKDAREKVSAWFGIKILGCLLVFLLTFVSLSILRVNYSISISLLAGILNFIPIIGPLITGVLIFVLGFLSSFSKALLALILFILIQQIESVILLPLLAKKFLDIPPFIVLLSLLIGGKILGIGGAILAVPLMGIFFKIFRELLE